MEQKEIIEAIKSGGLVHDKALSNLYSNEEYKNPVIKFLRSKKLSLSESDTLWTDVVIEFAKLVRSNKYQHQGNITGYLLNLTRFLFLNFVKKRSRNTLYKLPLIEQSADINEYSNIYSVELKSLINNELQKTGDTCKEILKLWSRGYKMAEIMKIVHVVSTEAIRKRKHKCLKTLLHNVDSNKELKMLLKEYLVS